jgi:hypothetical protein
MEVEGLTFQEYYNNCYIVFSNGIKTSPNSNSFSFRSVQGGGPVGGC